MPSRHLDESPLTRSHFSVMPRTCARFSAAFFLHRGGPGSERLL